MPVSVLVFGWVLERDDGLDGYAKWEKGNALGVSKGGGGYVGKGMRWEGLGILEGKEGKDIELGFGKDGDVGSESFGSWYRGGGMTNEGLGLGLTGVMLGIAGPGREGRYLGIFEILGLWIWEG